MQGACSLTYPLFHAQDPYYPRPLWLHHIFRCCLINGMIFENKKKGLLKPKMFWFSLQLLLETVLILSRIKQDVAINLKMFSSKVPVIFVGFWLNLKFSRQIFEVVSNIKFHQNPSSWNRVVPREQMDMRKVIVAFRNFANAPKNSEGRDSANQQVVYLLVSTGQQGSVEDTYKEHVKRND